MATRAHEHFCWACYGRKTKGVTRAKSGSGWWRCSGLRCAKAQAALCRVHADKLAAPPR